MSIIGAGTKRYITFGLLLKGSIIMELVELERRIEGIEYRLGELEESIKAYPPEVVYKEIMSIKEEIGKIKQKLEDITEKIELRISEE
ncbi:MAG TPA: hypothetical protein EYP22_10465, partial [Methanosarcinales archaeon]|nr:hypothetical protein [Methanosarcinales archaeon]